MGDFGPTWKPLQVGEKEPDMPRKPGEGSSREGVVVAPDRQHHDETEMSVCGCSFVGPRLQDK